MGSNAATTSINSEMGSNVMTRTMNAEMGSNKGKTTIKRGTVNDLDKSGESTETLETSEMSEASRVSFDEYKEMVDNFNERMDPDPEKQHHARNLYDQHATTYAENMNSMIAQASSPADIAKYASGIWYPECRDCRCCQGFKHGCVCAPINNGVCMCVTGGVPDDVSVMTMNSYDIWYQQSQLQCYPIELQFRGPLERRGSRRRVYNKENGQTKTNSPCRFFFSETGCRYGDACPFNHTK